MSPHYPQGLAQEGNVMDLQVANSSSNTRPLEHRLVSNKVTRHEYLLEVNVSVRNEFVARTIGRIEVETPVMAHDEETPVRGLVVGGQTGEVKLDILPLVGLAGALLGLCVYGGLPAVAKGPTVRGHIGLAFLGGIAEPSIRQVRVAVDGVDGSAGVD